MEGMPAPYGQACTNCSKAKSKCIVTSSGQCERCIRRNKRCERSVPGRPRQAKQAISKTAQLEKKLDDLASMMELAQSRTPLIVYNGSDIQGNDVGGSPWESMIANPSQVPTSPAVWEPSPSETEECFYNFKTQKLPFCPFIFMPTNISTQQLRVHRPFLWLCIIAVSTRSMSQKRSLAIVVRSILSDKVLFGHEVNLDLLLGLLVYVFWSNDQTQGRPYTSPFTHLAVSVVFELGINQDPQEEPAIPSLLSHVCAKPFASTQQLMEEGRAVLGCYLLSASVASGVQKADPLRWTPYMDDCLKMLAEKKECRDDEILVFQIRLQRIVAKVVHTLLDYKRETDLSTSFPLMKSNLLAQVHRLRQELPPSLQDHNLLLLHLHSTEIFVYQMSLPRFGKVHDRYGDLSACLKACRDWLDVFYTFSPAMYSNFSYTVFLQLSHTLGVLFQLSVLDDPLWDTATARSTADLSEVLNHIADNFSRVAELAEIRADGQEDVFTNSARKIASVRASWVTKLSNQNPPKSTQMQELFDNPLSPDIFDQTWLTDMVESFEP